MMLPKEEFKPFTYFFVHSNGILPDFIHVETPPTSIWVRNVITYSGSYLGHSLRPGKFVIKLSCSLLPTIVELQICEAKLYEIFSSYNIRLLIKPYPLEKFNQTYSSLEATALFTDDDFLLTIGNRISHLVKHIYDKNTMDTLKIFHSAMMYQKALKNHFNIKPLLQAI